MNFLSIILLFFYGIHPMYVNVVSSSNVSDQELMIEAVNKIRATGCKCGSKYMIPVGKVQWNNELYKSAMEQAKEMHNFNFFAHYSVDGLNIGQRLEKVGYNWEVAGENLGEGQISFYEVLADWMKSESHCKMVMHPKVNEMAIAKFNKYWVQHFGKKLNASN